MLYFLCFSFGFILFYLIVGFRSHPSRREPTLSKNKKEAYLRKEACLILVCSLHSLRCRANLISKNRSPRWVSLGIVFVGPAADRRWFARAVTGVPSLFGCLCTLITCCAVVSIYHIIRRWQPTAVTASNQSPSFLFSEIAGREGGRELLTVHGRDTMPCRSVVSASLV